MLHSLSVILVRPRFPENIGMVARAMANMGVMDLMLIEPERWDAENSGLENPEATAHAAGEAQPGRTGREKAAPLATSQGQAILDAVAVLPTLSAALAPFSFALGTTARTGGRRTDVLTPEKAADLARSVARRGERVALVFGPEDRGLSNEDVDCCSRLVHIPTLAAHSSLNLAQAVLILLYECVKADMALPFDTTSGAVRDWTRPARSRASRRIDLAEETLLLHTLEETLVDIEYLPKDNPGWFMQPLRRFIRKNTLRRFEFDMFMGICRQIRHALGLSQR